MADVTITALRVAPLVANGAVIRDYDAGGTLTVGDAVYIASDGDVEQTDASAESTAFGIGMVVDSYDGTTTIAAGERVPVCVFGPVSGFSGATPGSKGWISNTAGQIADAAGDNAHELGYFESATILFVNPDPAGAGS